MAFPRFRMPASRRTCLWDLLVLAFIFAAIQFVPYGRDRAAQPARRPFAWKAPDAERIARSACYDCHSSETRWWWAVKVAPFSWLARSDINEARRKLDFSDWTGRLSPEGLQRALDRGMPPIQYTLFHPEARLGDAQKRVLVDGFRASVVSPPVPAPGSDPCAIIEARCASCHSSEPALRFRASSPGEAGDLLDKMVKRGAQLTEAERKILLAYYTR